MMADFVIATVTSLFAVCRCCLFSVHNIAYKQFKMSTDDNTLVIEKDNKKREILMNCDLLEQFELFYDDHSCFVVDLNTGKEIFYSNDFTYPYSNKNYFHIFNDHLMSNARFLCTDGEYVWDPNFDGYQLPLNEAFYGVSSFPDNYIPITSIPTNATAIEAYDYYLKLKAWHGLNDCNACTLISIQMLMGYYDCFLFDSFVPEKWDKIPAQSITSVSNWRDWDQSPGTGSAFSNTIDSRMRDYLLDYTINHVNPFIETLGLTFTDQRTVLNYYMQQRDIAYTLTYSEGNPSDLLSNYSKTIIEEGIDNNQPVIANGGYHSVVAFAYDDDFVYVHTGYGDCAALEWHYFTDWDFTYLPSAMYISLPLSHSHCNNYYSTATNHFYCSCGHQMFGNLTNINSLLLPSLPSQSIVTSNYHDGFNAQFTYTNTYYSNGELIIDGDGYCLISSTTPIYGIFLECYSSVSIASPTNIYPSFWIEFEKENGDEIYSYDCVAYSDLINSSYLYHRYIALNSYYTTKRIRIRVQLNWNYSAKIHIKKLVLAIC